MPSANQHQKERIQIPYRPRISERTVLAHRLRILAGQLDLGQDANVVANELAKAEKQARKIALEEP